MNARDRRKIIRGQYFTVMFSDGSFSATKARFGPGVLRFYTGDNFHYVGYVRLNTIQKISSTGSCVRITVS